MSDTFLDRMLKYLAERFPLTATIPSSLFGMVGLFLLFGATTPGASTRFSSIVIIAFLSFFLLTFILRMFDEIKDREVDRVLFPDRLLSKGEVLYSDIHKMLITALFIWVPLNYIFGNSPFVFTVLCVYCFLFFKYFFVPNILSKNILLALVTHNPLMFLASFYICTLYAADQELPLYTFRNMLLALIFWMPSISWETARKVRAPKDETDYQTYSKLIGPRLAVLIPMGATVVQALSIHAVSGGMQHQLILRGVVWGLCAVYLIFTGLFMITLDSKVAASLQKITEAHIILFSFAVVLICGFETFS